MTFKKIVAIALPMILNSGLLVGPLMAKPMGKCDGATLRTIVVKELKPDFTDLSPQSQYIAHGNLGQMEPDIHFSHTFDLSGQTCCSLEYGKLIVQFIPLNNGAQNDTYGIGSNGDGVQGMNVYKDKIVKHKIYSREIILSAKSLARANKFRKFSFNIQDDSALLSLKFQYKRCCMCKIVPNKKPIS